MHDAHAHVFPEVHGRTRQGITRSLRYGRIQHGESTEQLLTPLSLETRFPVESLIANLDWNGIHRAMLLQGPFYGTTNGYQAAALEAYPDRLTGALYFDPWEDQADVLSQLVASGIYRALKLELSEPTGLCGLHPGADLAAPELGWIWRLLAQSGLTLTLDLGAPGTSSYQTEAVGWIARDHPDLHILICHLGQPRPACLAPGAMRDRWFQQLELGLLSNVWFDCASLAAYFPHEEFPFPSAVTFMHQAFNVLGPEKILWGTDQPGLLQWLSLRQMVQQARLYAAHLDAIGWQCFVERNFVAVYQPWE